MEERTRSPYESIIRTLYLGDFIIPSRIVNKPKLTANFDPVEEVISLPLRPRLYYIKKEVPGQDPKEEVAERTMTKVGTKVERSEKMPRNWI